MAQVWIRRFHPADAPIRLLYLPHAGGAASSCHWLSRMLSPAIEVLAAQYPGRQDRLREPVITDVRVLADRLLDEGLPGWLDRPLGLFGHSMGALVAYELALRLQRAGTEVVTLVASGRRAPARHRAEAIHQGSDAAVVAELRRLAGTDEDVLGDEALLHAVMPAIRGDYQAAETYRYRPEPPLRCPVVVLRGANDAQVTSEEAQDWARHTRGGFQLRVFTGGHFFLDQHQDEIADVVRGRLAPAQAARE